MLGDAVARAFLKALVKLIGGYWNALKLKPGEKITFSPELFVQTRPSSMQPFLQKMLELQIFQQFIESRLKKLNAGQGVSDEFEFELTAHEDKTSFRLRNQYRDWVSNMKKEGGAFFKHVKTKVKDTSKKAYKDIRSRIHDIHNQMTIQDDIPNVPKRRGSVPTSLDIHSAHHRKQHIIKNVYKKENFVAS
ncbi:DENN domain-containing protein 1A, partial [Stegodyphus mimosarum]